MNDTPEQILDDVRARLKSDPRFEFKQAGKVLRQGRCPECGKKECYVYLDTPFLIRCGRSNNCGWSESTRKLYPDLFDNFSKRYANDPNPNAAADAYMKYNRGFDPEKLRGFYYQASKKLKNGEYADTVRVNLWDGHYWERLIDADKVEANDGRKAMFSYGSQGKITGLAWIPPNMTIEPGDRVILTEGIFKSIAWILTAGPDGKPYKSITGMSAGNLPLKTIDQYRDLGVTWILALDNDRAGHDAAERFRDEMRRMKQHYLIAFPRYKGEDWDDLYRKGALNDRMLQESLWRGWVDTATSIGEKAAYLYARHRRKFFLADYDNTLYRCEIEDDQDKYTYGKDGNYEQPANISDFARIASFKEIGNCAPDFLYFERNAVTGELTYCFNVPIGHGADPETLTITGDLLKSPDSWNSTLLKNLPGKKFSGNSKDLDILHKIWFSRQVNYVRSLPFVGYDKETKAYAFPEWGAYGGKLVKPNELDYLEVGKERLKCGFRTDQYTAPGQFSPAWLRDFSGAFAINGMVVLSWWLGTLFAEQIRGEFGYWPVLEVTGEQGTGKTQMIEFLWRCCGRDEYEGFDPSKSTLVGRSRNFQQVSNLPVVLLEGDREDGKSWDYNELKMLYNGRYGRAIGVKSSGNETAESVFRGGVLVAQNATISTDAEAVLARIVHIHCTKEHFTPAGEEMALRLNRMTVKELSGFIGETLKQERRLLEAFRREFKRIDDSWLANRNIQNRIVHNHAMVAAWANVLPVLFGSACDRDEIPRLETYIWSRAVDRQARCSADHPLLAMFWEQYEWLQSSRIEHGCPINLLNHSKNPSEIAINLTHFQEIAGCNRLESIPLNDLKRVFPTCRAHKYLGNRPVASAIRNGATVRCFVFSAEGRKEKEKNG